MNIKSLRKYQTDFYKNNKKKQLLKRAVLSLALLLTSVICFFLITGVKKRDKPGTPNWQVQKKEEPDNVFKILSDLKKRGYPKLDLIENGKYVEYSNGYKIIYTVSPELQQKALKIFEKYNVPYGSFIAIDPATGRLLAYSSYSQAKHSAPLFNIKSTYPAASLFKLIVASAVLEEGLLSRSSVIGFRGNPYRLNKRKIKNNPRYDKNMSTLENALSKSNNVVFAKIGANILGSKRLAAYADRFLFNNSISFDFPVENSHSSIPEERYKLARVSAGFRDVTISPLHSALITAAIANNGKMPRPFIVESIYDRGGKSVYQAKPAILKKIISVNTAAEMRKMMLKTTQTGTSSKTFRLYARSLVKKVKIGGKTGSLYARHPRGFYDWYVGFAPEKESEIAISALVINGYKWRIKGAYVGQATFKTYFKNREKAL